jgi:hypothetical protein
MSKFKNQVDVVDNGSGNYTVEYNIFSPGRKYTVDSVTKTQIDEYNTETKDLPGVRVEIKLNDAGPGNPFSINGSFDISAPLELTPAKPFLEVVYLVWDEVAQKHKGNGHSIVRPQIPD